MNEEEDSGTVDMWTENIWWGNWEKIRGWNWKLYIAFLDVKKAYDRVDNKVLGWLLKDIWCE